MVLIIMDKNLTSFSWIMKTKVSKVFFSMVNFYSLPYQKCSATRIFNFCNCNISIGIMKSKKKMLKQIADHVRLKAGTYLRNIKKAPSKFHNAAWFSPL